MMQSTLKKMSVDELWSLRETVAIILAKKMTVEKEALELRLKQLGSKDIDKLTDPPIDRRPYPKVFPKFRNPDQPSETWAGRGKRPRWLVAELKSGKRIDDFRIDQTAA